MRKLLHMHLDETKHCFVCGPDNPKGLKLEPYVKDENAVVCSQSFYYPVAQVFPVCHIIPPYSSPSSLFLNDLNFQRVDSARLETESDSREKGVGIRLTNQQFYSATKKGLRIIILFS